MATQDYSVAHEEMSRLGTRLQPTTAAALAAAHAAESSIWDALTPAQVLPQAGTHVDPGTAVQPVCSYLIGRLQH